MKHHIVDSLVEAFKAGQDIYVDAVLLASSKSHRVKIIGAAFEPNQTEPAKNFMALGINIETASIVLMTGFDQGASISPTGWTHQYGAIHLMTPPHKRVGDHFEKQIEVETATAIAYFKDLFNKT